MQALPPHGEADSPSRPKRPTFAVDFHGVEDAVHGLHYQDAGHQPGAEHRCQGSQHLHSVIPAPQALRSQDFHNICVHAHTPQMSVNLPLQVWTLDALAWARAAVKNFVRR